MQQQHDLLLARSSVEPSVVVIRRIRARGNGNGRVAVAASGFSLSDVVRRGGSVRCFGSTVCPPTRPDPMDLH